jgi:hypothetical protein
LTQPQQEQVVSAVYSYAREEAKTDFAEARDIPYKPDKVVEDVAAAKAAGIPVGLYFVAKRKHTDFETKKNSRDRVVRGGSVKEQTEEWVGDTLNLPRQQEKALLRILGYKD